jgi:hypothetical protein
VSIPFTVSSAVTPGEEDGSTAKARSSSTVGTYTSKSEERLVFEGDDTEALDLGTLPSAKVLRIEYVEGEEPITLLFNGALTGGFDLEEGGFFLVTLSSITSVSVVHTAAAVIRVVALGG